MAPRPRSVVVDWGLTEQRYGQPGLSEHCRRPEAEHPANQTDAELSQSLLQLGVEACEVQLVELPKICAIDRIHGVEPVHEFVGGILAEDIVEAWIAWRSPARVARRRKSVTV